MPKGGRRSTSWKRGQSGNPSGRPWNPESIETRQTIADVREAAKALTPKALVTLERVMDDPKAPHSARVSAATHVLDRGWGRPKEIVDATVKRTSIEDFVKAIERAEAAEAFSEAPALPKPGLTLS